MANERTYLDYNGLAYFWGKLKEYFLKKIINSGTEPIIIDPTDDAHLILLSVSDDGNTKTKIDRILPAGSSCLASNTGDKYLVTAAAAKCIAKKCASNQNAFSNIAVSGQTTVSADNPTDTVTLVGGNTVSITTNATNDTVTITGPSFSNPLIVCSGNNVKVRANHTTNNSTNGLVTCVVGSGTTNLTCDSNKKSNTTIPTTGAVTVLINDAINKAGIPSDDSLYKDTTYDTTCTVLKKTIGDTTTPIVSASKIVEDGLVVADHGCTLKWNTRSVIANIYPKDNASAGYCIAVTMPVQPSYTDTKCTAGNTVTNNLFFVVGTQHTSTQNGTYEQTYTNANAYVQGGKMYSNAKEVVNVSDSQCLTNKTLNSTSILMSSTPTKGDSSTKIATTAFVQQAVLEAKTCAIHFCGALTASLWASRAAQASCLSKGTYFLASESGTYSCLGIIENGDMIYITSLYVSTELYPVNAMTTVVQSNLSRITDCNINTIVAS